MHPIPSIVRAVIDNKNVNILIDTGSSVNIIYATAIDPNMRKIFPIVKNPTTVRAYNSKTEEIEDHIQIKFKIGKKTFSEQFLIVDCSAPITYTAILGHCFMTTQNVLIDFPKKCVNIDSVSIPFVGNLTKQNSVNNIVHNSTQTVEDITHNKLTTNLENDMVSNREIEIFPVNQNVNNENTSHSVETIPEQNKLKKVNKHNKVAQNEMQIGKVIKKTVLNAATQSFVKVKCSNQFKTTDTILVEPKYINDKILIARSVCNFDEEGNYLVKVANISEQPVLLNKNTNLVTLEKILVRNINYVNTVTGEVDVEPDDEFEFSGGDFNLDHLKEQQKQKLKELLSKYKNVFATKITDLTGCDTIRHEIRLTDDRPVRLRPYKVPHHLVGEMERQISELLEADIIRPSYSPYNAPVCFVKKKEGSFRLVSDFRELNKRTIDENFPIPNITDLIDNLSGGKYFSTLDLASGFWQIKIHENDCYKTAFSTPQGHYHWVRLPFGLKNSPHSFQRIMALVLAGEAGVYIDDIVVASSSFSEHLTKLENVFKKLQAHNLKLKPSKCHFFCESIKYLGFRVSEGKVEPDPTNVELVQKFKVPTSKKEVRQFLGLTGFYRRFILNYAKIALPITALTKNNDKFLWTPAAQEAFEILKQKLVEKPILTLPDFKKPFVLHTDASKYALGAVLSQADSTGFPLPIAYASRKLLAPEVNYSVVEKEALGIVWACRYFKSYLIGAEFTIYCDQASLSYILKHKDPTARIARWMVALNEFQFKIVHKPGRFNITADYLSRCIDENKNCPNDNQINVISKQTNSKPQEEISVTSDLIPRIIEEQANDKMCCEIKRRLKSKLKTFPQHIKYFIKDNVLMSTYKNPSNRHQEKERIMVPVKIAPEIIKLCHDSVFAAHAGTEKTFHRISGNYYWRGMRAQINNYVASCETCLRTRGYRNKAKAPMQLFDSTFFPGERAALDIIGPVLQSARGNRYILVITDHFTKWTEAYPLASIKTTDVLECLEDYICRHGVPIHLVTDQGSNIVSEAARVLYKKLGIIKHSSTPFHPQADGQVERVNSVVISFLRNILHEAKEDWDRVLQLALLAHRSSVHASTGETPAYLQYGRELLLPNNIDTEAEYIKYNSITDYSEDLQFRLHQAFKTARIITRESQFKNLQYRNQKTKEPVFDVGSKVFLYMPIVAKGKSKKLEALNRGVFTIIRKISPVTFEIQHDENPRNIKIVHADKLTFFPERRKDVIQNQETSSQGDNIDTTTTPIDTTHKFKTRVFSNSKLKSFPQNGPNRHNTRYNLRPRN